MKKLSMKPETVKREIERIENDLSHIERGLYPNYSARIEKISDKIVWLWKYRHIDEKTMNRLCDRVIEVLGVAKYF